MDDIYNDEAVTEKIKEMEDKFHLVMIMENFEVLSFENFSPYQ